MNRGFAMGRDGTRTGSEITHKDAGLMADFVAAVHEQVGMEIPFPMDHFGHLSGRSWIRLARRWRSTIQHGWRAWCLGANRVVEGDPRAYRSAVTHRRRYLSRPGFRFEEADTAVRQIERLGHRPADVLQIILTHGDPDHAELGRVITPIAADDRRTLLASGVGPGIRKIS